MKFKIFKDRKIASFAYLKFSILILIIILAAVLRLWDLTNYPSGFNADEAAIGYNAYSLLQTGRDEYGARFPLAFKSFGDYKPGLYFYFVMPFVKALGLNEWAVRLPSALLGIATVLLIYFLAKKIFESERVGLLSALLLAISPWHIHFSRGGWESNAATFFITLGIFFWIKGLQKNMYFFWSMISFLISMYLYQSPRFIIPIFLTILIILYKNEPLPAACSGVFWFKNKLTLIHESIRVKKNIILFFLLIILAIPIGLQFTSGEGGARFNGLSFFADKGPLSRIDELRGEHGNLGSKTAQLLHNKITAYAPAFLGHYLNHFSTQFLFINGEEVIRNKVPETGEFYLIEALFLVIGLFALMRQQFEHTKLLVTWLLVAPLASAMTFQTPNALRSLNMVIPMTMVMGYGFSKIFNFQFSIFNSFNKQLRALLITGCFLLLTFEFTHYLEEYYVHYPKRYPLAWEYGFKEMVGKLEKYQNQYDKVVITDRYDQPYILVLFYESYDPKKYQPQAVLSPRDKFNFGTVRAFDKYEFRSVKPEELKSAKNTLFVGTEKEIPKDAKIFDEVDFPDGKPAFLFAKT